MLYLCIRQAGPKYVAYPSSEDAYQKSLASGEAGVWYYRSTLEVSDFAQANTFGAYDSQAAAESAIVLVDPGIDKIYKPPTQPSA